MLSLRTDMKPPLCESGLSKRVPAIPAVRLVTRPQHPELRSNLQINSDDPCHLSSPGPRYRKLGTMTYR